LLNKKINIVLSTAGSVDDAAAAGRHTVIVASKY